MDQTDHYLRPTDGMAARWVERELVAVHCRDGRMTVLNEAGGVLFALADGTRDATALAQALQASYELPAAPTVDTFLSELIEAGLLQAAPEASTARHLVDTPDAVGSYAPPAIHAAEPLETLAGACDSAFGIFAQCQLQGSCFDPQF
ncbi:MAG: PqqD family peptide modification chaperone [Planctomycetota bacterium]